MGQKNAIEGKHRTVTDAYKARLEKVQQNMPDKEGAMNGLYDMHATKSTDIYK